MSGDRAWITKEEAQLVFDCAGAMRDVIEHATAYGFTEDGDVHAYLVSKGAIHRLVAAAQSAGLSVGLPVEQPPTQEASA